MNKLALLKSSFPKGIPEAPKADEKHPLPTTFTHDESRNKLIIEVDLNALIVDPDKYINLMYETTGKGKERVKTDKVKGFNLLAGLSATEDFAAVVRVGDSATGIKISRPWSGPSCLSFTVCDPETAERIKGTMVSARELAHAATS